jgi:hypothetical protein
MNNAYFNPSSMVISCRRLLQLMVDAAVEFFLLKMIRAGKLSLTAIMGSDNSSSFINACKEAFQTHALCMWRIGHGEHV